MRVQRNLPTLLFLSTLSLRRATGCNIVAQSTPVISIHALLAESDATAVKQTPLANISIHALLAESDCARQKGKKRHNISIHALLAESDAPLADGAQADAAFLSTLSLRRATKYHTSHTMTAYISIHALLAESDPRPQPPKTRVLYFYPRSPCGERP